MEPPPPRIQPIAEPQRIALLDVLRGFAVLGILLANIPFMAMAGAITTPFGAFIGGDHWTDRLSHDFVFLFADTKFITLFSTLFGAGLGLMSEKALAADAPFNGRYIRRLAVLFLFGAAHVILLWFGDILIVYSMIGFVAMWFRKRRVRTLLVWAAVLLVLNGILWGLLGLVDPGDMVTLQKGPDGKELSAAASQAIVTEKIRAALSGGTLPEMIGTRLGIFAGSGGVLLVIFGMRTLGLFLLGIAAIKSGFVNQFMADRKPLFRVVAIGLGFGIPIQATALFLGTDMTDATRRIAFMSCWYVAGLLMALGYVAAFTLWMHTNFWLGLRTRLAAVGRMALTNYITHSLITSVVFNHLGYFDAVRRPYLLLMVFAIFAFQLWISPIWLRSFRYGPLEWVWRSATYWQRMPMRRS